MEDDETSFQCRICFCASRIAVALGYRVQDKTLAECINLFVPGTAAVGDEFSQQICFSCFENLVTCLNFRKKIETSSIYLKQLIKSESDSEEKSLPITNVFLPTTGNHLIDEDDEEKPTITFTNNIGTILVSSDSDDTGTGSEVECEDGGNREDYNNSYLGDKANKKELEPMLMDADKIEWQNVYNYNLRDLKPVTNQKDLSNQEQHREVNGVVNLCMRKRIQRVREFGPVTCFHCGVQYKTKDSLKKHILSKHNSNQTATKQSSPKVITPVISIERKQCCKCGVKFESEELLRAHFNLTHPIEPIDMRYPKTYTYSCDFCFQKFWKRSHFEEHFENPNFVAISPYKKSKGLHICPHCGKILTKRRFLDLHIASYHTTVKNFECSLCDKRFSHEKILKKHLNTTHVMNTFICDICAFKTTSLPSLRNHMFLHMKRKRLNCPHCPKGYSLRHNLVQHIKSEHSNESHRHKCEKCGNAYKWAEDLKRHILRVHRGIDIANCMYCGKGYTSKSSNKYHELRCTMNPNAIKKKRHSIYVGT